MAGSPSGCRRFGNYLYIGEIPGRAIFQAIKLVADCRVKKPFAPGLKLHATIKRQGMQRGLMVYPVGGTIDGACGDHVLMRPLARGAQPNRITGFPQRDTGRRCPMAAQSLLKTRWQR